MLPMVKELNFLRGIKGLGKRELPSNPNAPAISVAPERLSKNARNFWERRKYGAFAASILRDNTIKIALDELSPNETRLFGHYLVGILASDDRQFVRALPKGHPDRKGFAEVFWYEKQMASGIIDDMIESLAEKTEEGVAVEAVEQICQELAGASGDAKRIFFRKLTTEVGAVERDNLIASCLRSRAAQIARTKEQAFAKSS